MTSKWTAAAATTLVVLLGVIVGCDDKRAPTEPGTAPSALQMQSIVTPPSSGGVSTICLVNQKALADLDGQLQDNPDNAQLQAEHAVQAEITTDVCG